MLRHTLAGLTMLIATLLLPTFAIAAPAEPVSQGSTIDRYWSAESLTDMEIDLTPIAARDTSPYYWAHMFYVRGADGGYMGLQSRGDRRNGTQGRTALFALWGANASRSTTGAVCRPFDNEGSGHSCMLSYEWRHHHTYGLRVRRLNRDRGGQWWSASVIDRTAGTVKEIGRIRVAGGLVLEPYSNTFSEYFGPALASCSSQPYSLVKWGQASGDRGAARITHSYPRLYGGTCENARVTPNGDGTFQQESGTVGPFYEGEAMVCGALLAPYKVNGHVAGALFFGARSWVTPLEAPWADHNRWVLENGQQVYMERRLQCPYGR